MISLGLKLDQVKINRKATIKKLQDLGLNEEQIQQTLDSMKFLTNYALNEKDWDNIKIVTPLLEIWNTSHKRLEGAHTPMSDVLPVIINLIDAIDKYKF